MSHPSTTGLALLIVDDHTVVREGLEVMLRSSRDIRSVTTVGSASHARQACESSLPDVVLLDLRMPDEDGFSAMASLLAAWPDLKVIILSGNSTPAEVTLAKRQGAAGFLGKSSTRSVLLGRVKVKLDRLRGDCRIVHGTFRSGLSAHRALLSQATRNAHLRQPASAQCHPIHS